jgi:hypothetical protein
VPPVTGDGMEIHMGKKYIIEIEEIPFEQQHPDVFTKEGRMAVPRSKEHLFRAVGFKSLVFTKEELERLTPFPEDDRNL